MSYDKITHVIIEKVYPMVEKSLNTNLNKYKNAIADFINKNSALLYDVAPYNNIRYTESDAQKLFSSFDFTENDICEVMKDCFYWNIPYRPQAAKEPYVIVLMMCIRYFLLKKKQKEAEISAVYLAFTGKMYASLYGGLAFPKAEPANYRAVMDYVVNNMLSDKFDLRVYGNVFSAVRSLCITWLNTYGSLLCKNPSDDEIGKKMIQQLRDREKSFLMNIAKLYYTAYENKNYLNYETDNLSDGEEFRISDNDSLKATRYTENTVNYLMNNSVSLQICNKCKDENIKPTEIKDIMEAILGDKNNINDIYRVVNILICDFIKNYPKKTIGSVDFIAHSIKAKPNTKDKYILELYQIITNWLDENSASYRKRKSRIATAISYRRAILMYFTLAVNFANR